MVEQELKNALKTQAASLEDLVVYLEDCRVLGSEQYHYCQTKLREVLEHLKRLECLTGLEEIQG